MVSGLAPGRAGRDLDGREIDLRQRRHGQQAEGDRARERERRPSAAWCATGRRINGEEIFMAGSAQ